MAEQTSYLLRVADVVTETKDACSVVFDVTPEQARKLDYRPGQFLTVRVPSERCGSVARCYSLSSSPYTDDALTVTVKRTPDGYASHWIGDNIMAGAQLEVLAPSGIFTPDSLDEDLLLFAAGSGITPVMSIVRSVLAKGTGKLFLVYANRDEHSVIFRDKLTELAAANPDRLTVIHWLESVQGLPSTDQLRALAEPLAQRNTFICGPQEFMKAARAALKALDVPRSRRHIEKFVSLGGNPFEDTTIEQQVTDELQNTDDEPDSDQDTPDQETPGEQTQHPANLSVQLDGQTHAFSWPRNQKLLDFLLEQGLDAPFSCREGACSACACILTSGEVRMLNNDILEPVDLDEGIRLACQSLPVTDDVEVTYE